MTDEIADSAKELETARGMSRREAVQLLGALPFASILSLSAADQERARVFVDAAMEAGSGFAPSFFTDAEFRAVRILADTIIPRDARSGNATDAGVPEFMDFTMADRPDNQPWMRSGLAWLDAETQSRFSKSFSGATEAERNKILDDIAWPARAPKSLADGVAFFNRFRDLTATGFWSSRIGVRDLRYIGNKFVPAWNGCPQAALDKLGVSYAKFDAKNLKLIPPVAE